MDRSIYPGPPQIHPHTAGTPMIAPQKEWQDIIRALKKGDGKTVYVTGASDRGKSTFCRYLIQKLTPAGTTAYLDLDTGQSTIGPPATLGLAVYRDSATRPASVQLRFVGSISPAGHFIQLLSGAKRLFETAETIDSVITVIDSPGYVRGGIARELHFHMIDLLQPDHLVAFQKRDELEPILKNFRDHPSMRIHRFSVPPQVKSRSSAQRKNYREQRFRKYFSGATRQKLSLSEPGIHGHITEKSGKKAWQNLLIALCDNDRNVLTLAIVEDIDLRQDTIIFRAPPFDSSMVSSIHTGSVKMD